MKALVTGGTGFVGGNVVRELLRSGYEVKALARKGSNLKNIDGLSVEVAWGDLRDQDSLERALEGCEVLFHVAAVYSFWTPDRRAVYETNVQGSRDLFAIAIRKGIKKVVYTSTESTIGIDGCNALGCEDLVADAADLAGEYRKTKFQAERLALSMCRDGLPVVIVNPTVPIGAHDVKPTPTGQMVVSFINRKMPGYVNTGLNVIDVEDVARGHVLALEKGRIGERYILGNKNVTLKEIFAILERITGEKAPAIKIPLWLAMCAAYVDELVEGKLARRQPRVPLAGVKSARKFRCFDCSKSVRELGLPQTPIEEAFEKAVRWFRGNGYAR